MSIESNVERINWTSVAALTDEPQDQDFWEPWQPKIGDRVRVRLNGECRFETSGFNRYGVPSKRYPTHREWENGKTGTVIPCRFITSHGFCSHASDGRGHWIVVQYDIVEDHPDINTIAGHYAAVELEPIT